MSPWGNAGRPSDAERLHRPGVVHPTQRRLLAFLAAEPGRSLQEMADYLGVTRTAVVYHVRRLERARHIVALEQGNRRLLFPANGHPPAQRSLLGVLRLRNAWALAAAIRADPTASWRTLARRLGLTPSTVRWHVARLEEGGLVRIVEDRGRRHLVTLHPDLEAALAADPRRPAEPNATSSTGAPSKGAQRPSPQLGSPSS